MIDLYNLYLFIGAAFVLCLAPGPDNIYVMTQGVIKGKKAAIVTTLGLSSGVIIHTTAAAFGISVIFKTSELAFNLVKFAGALYLLYLAYMAFKYRNEPLTLENRDNVKELKKLYVKGFFMNVLNPKVSIFFLAFLPQFVSVQNGSIPIQMVTLGIVFMLLTIIVFSSMGVLANKFGEKIIEYPSVSKYLNIISSGIFFSLGVKLAITQR